ncbi:hypothetical protein AMAG_09152 [Allomyces macrogynus ATCC 38327]|uniref:ABC transporter domain-containing protein n=1 Tax=Allomyces macrogynus (strain ATCC 38327) TaxID=578462 RepID=A0A0L0SNZ8_ALLM3|nr:hypothetical protein AMAG_09152 [Allomyces macrogynus ATCC 38327]|eukprot:KNE64090.1 hypothetical protein AMAG_09152 [Allomyces macrogynus ATCC 38327]
MNVETTTSASPDIEAIDTATPVAANRNVASASTTSEAAAARQPTPIPVLPDAQRLNIAASHLDYAIVRGKDDERAIIKDVSLLFPAGKLTVILGASGAGKTSLLNVVAGETRVGKITGAMYLNGQPTTGSNVKKVSGFVHQDDIVLGTMTVLEAITMSAKLRLPHTLSDEDKGQKVQEIIHMLDLTAVQSTIIGTATEKGISGGERKRVMIAMELVTSGACIFLDEPTSGLDSYTAFSVMQLLRRLAASGRTVVATLHQPSSEIFHLIDNLVLLASGEVMFAGSAEHSIEYFARQGFPCPQFSNPCDYYFMSILNTTGTAVSATRRKPSAEETAAAEARIARLLQAWKDSPEHAAIMAEIASPSRTDGITTESFKYMSRFTDQFPVLFSRAGRNAIRNKLIVTAKIGQMTFLGLLLGLTYLNIPDRSFAAQIQDRTGVLFFIAIGMLMASAMGVLTVFSSEKQVFQREFGGGFYGLPAFFFSKVAVELPFQIIMPWLMVSILYFLTGLQKGADKYFIASGLCILMYNSGAAIGMLAACAFDDITVALAIVPLVMIPLMLFSGLFLNSANIPVFLDWIKYISPIKYGFVGMTKNEFTGLKVCPNESDSPILRRVGCQPGEATITNLGFDDQGSIVFNVLILVALWVGLVFLSYLALWRIVRTAKRVDLVVPSTKADKKGGKAAPTAAARAAAAAGQEEELAEVAAKS